MVVIVIQDGLYVLLVVVEDFKAARGVGVFRLGLSNNVGAWVSGYIIF